MGVRLLKTGMVGARHIFRGAGASHASSSSPPQSKRSADVPKGHLAVYVGDGDDQSCKQRFVVPISYLKHPLFQDLLKLAEEEYGFSHPMGGLTIPCTQNAFLQACGLPCGPHRR